MMIKQRKNNQKWTSEAGESLQRMLDSRLVTSSDSCSSSNGCRLTEGFQRRSLPCCSVQRQGWQPLWWTSLLASFTRRHHTHTASLTQFYITSLLFHSYSMPENLPRWLETTSPNQHHQTTEEKTLAVSTTQWNIRIRQNSTKYSIYTTINFTDEFRNVSVTLGVGADWLAGRVLHTLRRRGGRGQHTLSIDKS